VIHTCGALALDTETREISSTRGSIRLSPLHYAVAERLMRRVGAIVSLSDLVSAAWPDPDNEPADPEGRIRDAIKTLRNSALLMGCHGGSHFAIISERGVGYFVRAGRVRESANV